VTVLEKAPGIESVAATAKDTASGQVGVSVQGGTGVHAGRSAERDAA
jgi:RND superfamily putative drug exporter